MFSVPLPALPTYKSPALGPGRAGAVHRRRARRAGVGADVAGRVADAAAVEDVQRAVAGIANIQSAGIGPGRADTVHRHRARRAGLRSRGSRSCC